ncbi:MAG: hypothetical protein A2Z18_10990 [Armatimonadetes bacterium RBG_16_58_9]|nr:MAG: hypothetical protein A2Z18_10990 [Armatimonadetes bacterium RBG_16_58_9]
MRRVLPILLGLAFLGIAAGAASGFSLEDEIKLGQEVAKEVEKEMPPSENQKWQDEISEMGKRFLPYVGRKDIPYHFRIVQAREKINAFALPGGYVYFTERMWQIMTPAERAGILAHEITHCDQRHGGGPDAQGQTARAVDAAAGDPERGQRAGLRRDAG